MVLLVAILVGYIAYKNYNKKDEKDENEVSQVNTIATKEIEKKNTSKYEIKSKSLEDFDLSFLQLENERTNKVYSPLSIKYTLGMLNEGTSGSSKEQISSIIGNYAPSKYTNSKNLSFANGLFIRNTYKNDIKDEYVSHISDKYNAEIIYDSFSNATNINSWIKNKTLNLIDNLVSDDDVNNLNFALVNALAIDMDWKNKFLENSDTTCYFAHENYGWEAPQTVLTNNFKNIDHKVTGMEIIATINNYDIISDLGEDNIRKTVGEDYRKFINDEMENSGKYSSYSGEVILTKDSTQEEIDNVVNDYLNSYIKEIKENYKMMEKNTDFSFYKDTSVTAFAKDLKEYNGTTLQYVAIMPEEDLKNYIQNINATSISKILNNLIDLKRENFKEGVITEIKGFIPKFKYEYQLDLVKDLKNMGVEDVFDEQKADLSGITNKKAYIGNAMHKANIEFTQDGIKASAATLTGGRGGGSDFDHLYDVPIEKVNLTFDKPYMYLIRDKKTGEIWFAGTVYEPLDYEQEDNKEQIIDYIYDEENN